MLLIRRCAALAVALALVLLAPPVARAQAPMGQLPAGLPLGVYSPAGAAAAERARGLRLRTVYLTGGLDPARAWGSAGTRAWLDETRAAGQVPVLTYYQLDPGSPRGATGKRGVRDSLRSRSTMRRYWRDVRRALQVAGADRSQLVVLHVEPDGWEFMEQLGGVRARAVVGSSGMAELRGLPDTVGGYARAFDRLRDRYAPNVALAFHLSRWGVGQSGVPSVANSEAIGHLRATFVRALRGGFDLAVQDPGDPAWDGPGFERYVALLRAFHQDSGLPVLLWQMPADDRVGTILGDDPVVVARRAALVAAGAIGLLWNAGLPDQPSSGRADLLRLAGAA